MDITVFAFGFLAALLLIFMGCTVAGLLKVRELEKVVSELESRTIPMVYTEMVRVEETLVRENNKVVLDLNTRIAETRSYVDRRFDKLADK